MSLTRTERNKEAKDIIKKIFHKVTSSNIKDVWLEWLSFIDYKIYKLENWERWKEMFIWESVKYKMNNLYWKKFILKK